ncbi:MAG: serpin family protein [Bdellovibrionia bacterium]
MKIKLERPTSYLIIGLLTLSSWSFPGYVWSAQYSHKEFSPRLFRALTRSKELENTVISPYGLSLAMGLAAFGARNKTARQLGRAQTWTLRPEAFSKLWVANRLWVQKEHHLLNSYMDGSDRNYDVRPWLVDFTKAPDFLRDRINGWVEERTNSKVKEFVEVDSFDSSMKMLLSSVIFFRGDWATPFDKAGTHEDIFTVFPGTRLKANFMKTTGTFKHKKLNDFQILELPYTEKDLVMDILLPDSAQGLSSIEEALSRNGVESLLSEMTPLEVNVLLPKFEMSVTEDITEGLKSMGIEDAFTPELADFSGMTGKRDLYLSKMYHKAVIAVSEEGTTASTSANFVLRKPASVSAAASFYADHPFTFLIWNKATKVVLFLGHVAKPNGQPMDENGKQ